MIVTEKCDVYSFGVVALEVLMGKHPGELLSSHQNITLSDVLDPRLSPPVNRKVVLDIVLVSAIAFACLRSKPKSRPTMKFVSQESVSHKRLTASALHSISVAELKSGGMFAVGPTQQQCNEG